MKTFMDQSLPNLALAGAAVGAFILLGTVVLISVFFGHYAIPWGKWDERAINLNR